MMIPEIKLNKSDMHRHHTANVSLSMMEARMLSKLSDHYEVTKSQLLRELIKAAYSGACNS